MNENMNEELNGSLFICENEKVLNFYFYFSYLYSVILEFE